MARRTNAQIAEDAEKSRAESSAKLLRDAAMVYDLYGVPSSANVARVVADSIEAGTRKRVAE